MSTIGPAARLADALMDFIDGDTPLEESVTVAKIVAAAAALDARMDRLEARIRELEETCEGSSVGSADSTSAGYGASPTAAATGDAAGIQTAAQTAHGDPLSQIVVECVARHAEHGSVRETCREVATRVWALGEEDRKRLCKERNLLCDRSDARAESVERERDECRKALKEERCEGSSQSGLQSESPSSLGASSSTASALASSSPLSGSQAEADSLPALVRRVVERFVTAEWHVEDRWEATRILTAACTACVQEAVKAEREFAVGEVRRIYGDSFWGNKCAAAIRRGPEKGTT